MVMRNFITKKIAHKKQKVNYTVIAKNKLESDGSPSQNVKLIIDKSYEANLSKCAIDF